MLDPTIPLQAGKGVPQLTSPLEQFSNSLQLQNAVRQNQMGQMQMQQEQMKMQDQQNLRQIMSDPSIDWSKPNAMESVIQKGAAAGVSPQTLQTMRNSQMEFAKNFLAMTKEQQDIKAKALDQTRGELMALVADPTYGSPESQVKYNAIRQRHISAGDITPDQVPAMLPKDKNAFIPLLNGMTTGSALLKELQSNQGQVDTGSSIYSTQKNPITGQTKLGEKLTDKHVPPGDLMKFATDIGAVKDDGSIDMNNPWVKKKLAAMTTNMALVMGNSGGGSGAGLDLSKPLPEPGEEALAQAIARKEQTPLIPNMRTPGANRINARAAAIAGGVLPGTASVHEQQGGMVAFSPKGDQGKTLQGIDTATGHIMHLDQLSKALQNGDAKAINSASNWFRDQFGIAAPNNFNAVKSFVIPEVLKVAKGAGQINEAEERQLQSLVSTANSPAQLSGFTNQLKHIMASRVEALQPVYERYFPGKSVAERLRPGTVNMFRGIGVSLAPSQKAPSGPRAGDVEDGYRFKGGDASRSENWEKVQ